VTGANRPDSTELNVVLDAIPPVAGKRDDYPRCWEALKERGITTRIARRGIGSSEMLSRHRWVIERTHAWLAGFGKLRIRFELSIETHTVLLTLACSIICSRHLEPYCR
jgi:IS5 family transposase